MQHHWIVLANASRARICRYDKADGQIAEIANFVHPSSRQKGSELAADRGGHVEKGLGTDGRGGTQLQPRTGPRDKAHEQFARQLASYLDDAVAERECQSWVLLASDPFLGELKAHLGKAAKATLRRAVPVDLTSLQGPALRERLEAVLAAGP